jgi:hypothetical protein
MLWNSPEANMSGKDKSKRRLVDRLSEAATPKVDDSDVSQRSILWWFLVMPGKVILWIKYMFPGRVAEAFGTARRRNVLLLQVTYSIQFYLAVLILLAVLFLALG